MSMISLLALLVIVGLVIISLGGVLLVMGGQSLDDAHDEEREAAPEWPARHRR